VLLEQAGGLDGPLHRAAGGQLETDDLLAVAQGVADFDVDRIGISGFAINLPARLTKESTKVLAMWLNTGPTAFSMRRLENS
jgi:hypothetical protein